MIELQADPAPKPKLTEQEEKNILLQLIQGPLYLSSIPGYYRNAWRRMENTKICDIGWVDPVSHHPYITVACPVPGEMEEHAFSIAIARLTSHHEKVLNQREEA